MMLTHSLVCVEEHCLIWLRTHSWVARSAFALSMATYFSCLYSSKTRLVNVCVWIMGHNLIPLSGIHPLRLYWVHQLMEKDSFIRANHITLPLPPAQCQEACFKYGTHFCLYAMRKDIRYIANLYRPALLMAHIHSMVDMLWAVFCPCMQTLFIPSVQSRVELQGALPQLLCCGNLQYVFKKMTDQQHVVRPYKTSSSCALWVG